MTETHEQISVKVSWLYRLFVGGPTHILVKDGSVHLKGLFGDILLKIHANNICSIEIHRAWLWRRVMIRLTDGTEGDIGGIGQLEALRLREAVLQASRAFSARLEEVKESLRQFSSSERYVRHSESVALYKQIKPTLQTWGRLPLEHLDPAIQQAVASMPPLDPCEQLEAIRSEANKRFVSRTAPKVQKLQARLTDEQAEAIATDEDVTLVLAGAGTGKTSVIVGKVAHLIRNEGVSPSDILVLAFNRKAAAEVRERLAEGNLKGADVHTFHSFGFRVIQHSEGDQPQVDEEGLDRQFNYIVNEMLRDSEQSKKLVNRAIKFIYYGRPYQQRRKRLAEGPPLDDHEKQRIIRILPTFMNHVKTSNISPGKLRTRARAIGDPKRNKAFLSVFAPIRKRYDQWLANEDKRDFHDLINDAVRYLRQGRGERQYRYILVDEFQDISAGRMELLKALKRPRTAYFLVGDDWQSIYRFTGSDVRVFRNCGDDLGYVQERTLSNTFRFADGILKPSTAFITKNPKQTQRPLRSMSKAMDRGIFILRHSNPTAGRDDALRLIGKEAQERGERYEVLVLGRYRKAAPIPQSPLLRVEFSTVHSAKGREADYTIILDLKSGDWGFPCEIEDDPVLDLVLPPASGHTYAFAEERRLFYVAMTRARIGAYLVTDRNRPSEFVREIQELIAAP